MAGVGRDPQGSPSTAPGSTEDHLKIKPYLRAQMLLELSLTSSGQLCLSLVKWNCFWQSTGELISIYCPFRHIIFLRGTYSAHWTALWVCAQGSMLPKPAVGGGLSSSSGACGWDGVPQIYLCQPVLTCLTWLPTPVWQCPLKSTTMVHLEVVVWWLLHVLSYSCRKNYIPFLLRALLSTKMIVNILGVVQADKISLKDFLKCV